MKRAILVGLVAGTLLMGQAGARDWSSQWKFGAVLEPELRFKDGAEPRFLWKRVRGIARGPLSSRVNAFIQFDDARNRVRLMDGLIDYNAIKGGPVDLTFRIGQGYPAYAEDGWAAPVGIDYTFMSEQLKLPYRMSQVQATITANRRYQFNVGILNGSHSLLAGPNDRPMFLLGSSLIGRSGTAHAWGMTGFDRIAGAEYKSWMYGLELTNLHRGRLFGEGAWMSADRFGKKMNGVYGDIGYKFNKDALAFMRLEWCDTDVKTAGAIRQRWSLCAQQRLNPWIVLKCDVRYEQGTGHFESNNQLDIQF
ncbi:MAG: hypothetical protein HZB16_06385 [Armatimonadetes bacterium]|nr:hypothetical protein [Armatimonadota bacterium]